MKINLLFAFPLFTQSTSYELYKSLKNNSKIELFELFKDKSDEVFQNNGKSSIYKIFQKLKLPLDYQDINNKLLNYCFNDIDVLFTIKGNTIYPKTLSYIKKKYPNIKIVSWSQDDMYAWHNRSIYYTLGLKYYDLIVTQKSYNIKELESLGAKNILFQNKAFSKNLHKKYVCKKSFCDVLFIGHFEKDRYENMLYLAKNDIRVDVYGPAWKKYINTHENLIIHNKTLSGENYAQALSCAKISLCFLRKINRDLQTSRSIEIPACGGFMIAERTDEHKKLFKEDKEAVYFNTKEELLKKVEYYLENEEERKNIVKAGYERTRHSKYSYDDRVEEILEVIMKDI